ncbi:MAG: hypothetical protein NXY57DRAFT_631334 [Lentinula lateritia]|nr:MAG: hypothetical protein NXY57DRAFT_631334 [Lentinula lateritia]
MRLLSLNGLGTGFVHPFNLFLFVVPGLAILQTNYHLNFAYGRFPLNIFSDTSSFQPSFIVLLFRPKAESFIFSYLYNINLSIYLFCSFAGCFFYHFNWCQRRRVHIHIQSTGAKNEFTLTCVIEFPRIVYRVIFSRCGRSSAEVKYLLCFKVHERRATLSAMLVGTLNLGSRRC